MRYVWYAMYAFVTALAVYSLFFSPRRRDAGPEPAPAVSPGTIKEPVVVTPPAPEGDVQIALLLDTSSSMDGLLKQAQTQLWEIVGELQKDGQDRDRTVTVALYQYGNSRLDSESGFIEKLSELTPELDEVSVKLHALSTSGGKEHAPEAIARAVGELAWSDEDNVEKVIVIAGNEGFSQGSVSPETAMRSAEEKGIKIIPIFCANGGATSTGLNSWQRAAQLAGAKLDTIDPDQVIAKIETPYDAEIVRKYQELEKTRLSYGDAAFRQETESYRNSSTAYAAEKPLPLQADRAVTQARQKGKGDLVEAYTDKVVDIVALQEESLPAQLKGLTKEQQVQEVESRRTRRIKIQGELDALARQREGFISKAAPSAAPARQSLGSSVRHQLRGY